MPLSFAPRVRRRVALTVGFCAFATLVYLLRAREDASARPRTPTSDQEILEHLPTRGTDPHALELAKLRQSLAAAPNDLGLAVEVARLDIEESRSRSDPRFLGYAQSALSPWWEQPSPPPQMLLLRATIRQRTTHDLQGALHDLDLAVHQTPDDAQAWIARSAVLTERGDFAAAKHGCLPLARLAGRLVSVTCNAKIESLTGDAKGAYERLSAALDDRSPSGPTSETEMESAIATLGEVAVRAGDPKAAEQQLASALTRGPADTYALATWSDLLLDEGRAPEVAARLADREADDGLLLRLALAEAATHGAKAEEHRAVLRARFDASRARGDVVQRREESRFALQLEHDPRGALDLAIANWGVQHEPWDARAYLEAAAAAHDREAARPVLEWLDRTHLEDPAVAKLAASLRGPP